MLASIICTAQPDNIVLSNQFLIRLVPMRSTNTKIAPTDVDMPLPTVTRATLNALSTYHWPGNIREMQNVIERGVILARGGRLVFEPPAYEGESSTFIPITETDGFLTEAEMIAREKENLLACLHVSNGKVSGKNGAAELMGVKPTTFYSRMKKFAIKDKDWSK